MELELNSEKFEKRQDILVEELVKTIQVKLAEAGLDRPQINDLTLSIAFSITCMIDGVSGIEADGVDVRPYLTFQVGDDLVHGGENSFLHELIYDVTGKLAAG